MLKVVCVVVLMAALLFNAINAFKRIVLKEQVSLTLGFGTAVIISGSMEPSIRVGDMVIIHQQKDYDIKDIVTYQGNNDPITHRVVEKTAGGYVTQGDANNTGDGEIARGRIIGKVIQIIPGAGNVILFFQNPLGVLILILGLFAIIEVPRWIGKSRKRE